MLLMFTRNDLFETEGFQEKQLAAQIISQIYYNLQDYEKALDYCLLCGFKLDLDNRNLYIECMINKCIERYKVQQKINYEVIDEEDKLKIDNSLLSFYNNIVQDAIEKKQLKAALGISIETMRVDQVRYCVLKVLIVCRLRKSSRWISFHRIFWNICSSYAKK